MAENELSEAIDRRLKVIQVLSSYADGQSIDALKLANYLNGSTLLEIVSYLYDGLACGNWPWIINPLKFARVTKLKPIRVRGREVYRCQFCAMDALVAKWKGDMCPHCDRKYDAMLAQEGDD